MPMYKQTSMINFINLCYGKQFLKPCCISGLWYRSVHMTIDTIPIRSLCGIGSSAYSDENKASSKKRGNDANFAEKLKDNREVVYFILCIWIHLSSQLLVDRANV